MYVVVTNCNNYNIKIILIITTEEDDDEEEVLNDITNVNGHVGKGSSTISNMNVGDIIGDKEESDKLETINDA